ncbi:hypothetical protein Poly51_59770 [Rubripirellula tenax]|uniref:Uncharacterized protein n=1 Tax=Rubripirellula tenax TaxID=2528015 RepID=A0A5C6E778_9BACT|nr:hypothetical protein Poly51_59770 [Rubripirellula tenax]
MMMATFRSFPEGGSSEKVAKRETAASDRALSSVLEVATFRMVGDQSTSAAKKGSPAIRYVATGRASRRKSAEAEFEHE